MSAKVNIDYLVKALKGVDFSGKAKMVIGFNTVYAVVQHEALDFRHKAPGRAKYLETPVNQAKNEGMLDKAIQHHLKDVKTPDQIPAAVASGVRDCGLQILGEAQALAPVGGPPYSPYDKHRGTLAASAAWFGPDEGETGTLGAPQTGGEVA